MDPNKLLVICIHEFISYSSSDSSDEELNVLGEIEASRQPRRRIPRIKAYVETIIPQWTDVEFKSHFRMSRATFEFILSIIAPRLQKRIPGFPMIAPDKQFLLAIWRMATPDSFRSICERFDVSRSGALYITRRVTRIISGLAPAFIRWPEGDAVEIVWQGFETISAFPKVIGAIDGTHIYIPAPQRNPEAYINRKNRHSIQLQAICDHKSRFIHCYVGQVGSVHDQRVLRLSDFYDYLGNNQKFDNNCHLVGDAAYQLQEHLMVPFRDNGYLSDREKNFNFCLSSARIAIERAFGLLKGRFRSLLHVLPINRTDLIPQHVLACCVLHNICLSREELENFPIDTAGNTTDIERHPISRGSTEAGERKRISICATLIDRHV